MKKETKILQKIIENYVTKNLEMVQEAQKMSKMILDGGLLEPSKNMPFQILPTNLSDHDGTVICKLYVNMESPIYGFFTIELQKEKCVITCPATYHTQVFVASYEDCFDWIEQMVGEMDIFYEISEMASNGNKEFCSLQLNSLLNNYKEIMNPEIERVVANIKDNDKIAIVSDRMYALAKDAKNDFARALLLPMLWVVFKDLEDLPDEGEDVEPYMDKDNTDLLCNMLEAFAKQERYYSAPIYLAQRVCLQAGLSVSGFSVSENGWVEAVSSKENGEFVLPPIEMREFLVS